MSNPIELIPLRCLKCATNIPAQPDQVGWVCENCGHPQRLFEDDTLIDMRLRYASNIPPGAAGRPFWVASGKVELSRQTFNALFGKKSDAARSFWAAPRNFFIPAFACGMEQMIDMATTLVRQQPQLVDGSATPFTPITVRIDDVKSLIEFAIMAIEAERSDNVKEIDFSVNVGAPDLWVLP